MWPRRIPNWRGTGAHSLSTLQREYNRTGLFESGFGSFWLWLGFLMLAQLQVWFPARYAELIVVTVFIAGVMLLGLWGRSWRRRIIVPRLG